MAGRFSYEISLEMLYRILGHMISNAIKANGMGTKTSATVYCCHRIYIFTHWVQLLKMSTSLNSLPNS